MLTFYFLVGLGVGLYIVFNMVQPILKEAIDDGVNNPLTRNPTFCLVLNTLFIIILWPLFTPIFFSESFKEQIINGFSKAVNIEQ